MRNNYIYILIAFVVIYAIRVLPLTLIRKPLRSRFLRSFLYYVPYVRPSWRPRPCRLRGSRPWRWG